MVSLMQYVLTHAKIIDRVGPSQLAKELRLPKSTVYSWQRTGIIPAKHHPAVMEASRKLGVAVTPADFIGRVEGRKGATARSDAHV